MNFSSTTQQSAGVTTGLPVVNNLSFNKENSHIQDEMITQILQKYRNVSSSSSSHSPQPIIDATMSTPNSNSSLLPASQQNLHNPSPDSVQSQRRPSNNLLASIPTQIPSYQPITNITQPNSSLSEIPQASASSFSHFNFSSVPSPMESFSELKQQQQQQANQSKVQTESQAFASKIGQSLESNLQYKNQYFPAGQNSKFDAPYVVGSINISQQLLNQTQKDRTKTDQSFDSNQYLINQFVHPVQSTNFDSAVIPTSTLPIQAPPLIPHLSNNHVQFSQQQPIDISKEKTYSVHQNIISLPTSPFEKHQNGIESNKQGTFAELIQATLMTSGTNAQKEQGYSISQSQPQLQQQQQQQQQQCLNQSSPTKSKGDGQNFMWRGSPFKLKYDPAKHDRTTKNIERVQSQLYPIGTTFSSTTGSPHFPRKTKGDFSHLDSYLQSHLMKNRKGMEKHRSNTTAQELSFTQGLSNQIIFNNLSINNNNSSTQLKNTAGTAISPQQLTPTKPLGKQLLHNKNARTNSHAIGQQFQLESGKKPIFSLQDETKKFLMMSSWNTVAKKATSNDSVTEVGTLNKTLQSVPVSSTTTATTSTNVMGNLLENKKLDEILGKRKESLIDSKSNSSSFSSHSSSYHSNFSSLSPLQKNPIPAGEKKHSDRIIPATAVVYAASTEQHGMLNRSLSPQLSVENIPAKDQLMRRQSLFTEGSSYSGTAYDATLFAKPASLQTAFVPQPLSQGLKSQTRLESISPVSSQKIIQDQQQNNIEMTAERKINDVSITNPFFIIQESEGSANVFVSPQFESIENGMNDSIQGINEAATTTQAAVNPFNFAEQPTGIRLMLSKQSSTLSEVSPRERFGVTAHAVIDDEKIASIMENSTKMNQPKSNQPLYLNNLSESTLISGIQNLNNGNEALLIQGKPQIEKISTAIENNQLQNLVSAFQVPQIPTINNTSLSILNDPASQKLSQVTSGSSTPLPPYQPLSTQFNGTSFLQSQLKKTKPTEIKSPINGILSSIPPSYNFQMNCNPTVQSDFSSFTSAITPMSTQNPSPLLQSDPPLTSQQTSGSFTSSQQVAQQYGSQVQQIQASVIEQREKENLKKREIENEVKKSETEMNGIIEKQVSKQKRELPENRLVKSMISSKQQQGDIKANLFKGIPPKARIPSFIDARFVDNTYRKEQFRIGKHLGTGKFSDVYMAQDMKTGLIVALKKVKKAVLIKYQTEDYLENEIKIQTFFNHPNILKLYGFYYDEDFVYLVQEYATHGELYHELRRQPNEKFSEIKAAGYMRQIVDAFQYMHRYHVIHRDVKPENILVSHGVLKIADFGCSVFCPEDRRDTFCGTIDYISPEIVTGEGYGQSVDIWSLGVLVYELLTGKSPFQYDTKNEILYNILQVNINIPPEISPEGQDFMKGLLVRDPQSRMTMEQVINHPWITKNIIQYSQETWDHTLANVTKNLVA